MKAAELDPPRMMDHEDFVLFRKECRLAGYRVLDRDIDVLIGEERNEHSGGIIKGGWVWYLLYTVSWTSGYWYLYERKAKDGVVQRVG